MTDHDEFDRLRDRIETLEDELGLEGDAERLFPEDQYVWAKATRGSTDYYAAPKDIRMEDDGARDTDVNMSFRRAVVDSYRGLETRDDYEGLFSESVEFMSRPDVLDEVGLR